jgi:predicted ester cyclase
MAGRLVSADYLHTNSSGVQWRGTQRIKDLVISLHEVFSDLRYTIDAMVVESDLVATRTTVKAIHTKELLGFAPTHRPVEYNESF